MTTRYRRSAGLAVLAAVAALGLAGCGGGHSTPRSPACRPPPSWGAPADGNSGGSSATTLPTGNATGLVDDWAACMRSHGDPNQADPVIDADRVIKITGSRLGINRTTVRSGPRRHRSVQPVPDRGADRVAERSAVPNRRARSPGEVRRVHAGQRGPELPRPLRP